MSAAFISKYILRCAKQGIDTDEAICLKAREEIEKIDEQLNQAEIARCQRANLVKLLNHLGDNSYSRHKVSSSQDIDYPDEDDTPEAKRVRKQIVDLIKAHKAMTNQEIRTKVGYGPNADRLVIRAVKWLGEREILLRDRSSSENKLIPGVKFNEADSLLL